MWFAVLGPIDVRDDEGAGVSPTAPRLLSLLAVLLCRPNQAVSVDRLIDLVWGEHPSRSAHSSLQVYVHRLRHALGEDRVLRESPGYRLVVAPHELDVTCFEQRAESARRARQEGAPDRAAALFSQALGFWRHEQPYDGLPDNDLVRGERARLSELRLSVLEWRLAAGLDAGEHALLMDELAGLVDRYPYRQRFQALLMAALQRDGRPEKALAVYDRAEQVLVEGYGLEPGPRLRELRQRILQSGSGIGSMDDVRSVRASGGLVASADVGPTGRGTVPNGGDSSTDAQVVPGGQYDRDNNDCQNSVNQNSRVSQNSRDNRADRVGRGDQNVQHDRADRVGPTSAGSEQAASDRAAPDQEHEDGDRCPSPGVVPEPDGPLVARAAERATVLRHLTPGPDDPWPPTPVVAIAGPAGVGKSALARWAAHQLMDRYPDGQLYVNLRGGAQGHAGDGGVEPLDALGRLLTDLGESPTHVPGFEDEAAARFRSLTAGRRVLVVLDDAYDASQVRPLLPGAGGAAVLVTSRRALTALDGVQVVTLAPLAAADAVELLQMTVGETRVIAEAAAAAEVAELAGGLPLALRIIGARLAARPELALGPLAIRLREGRGRLDEWEHADQGVRASFALGYQALSPAAAEIFDLLGVLELPEVDVPLLAAVTGKPNAHTRRWVDELVDARLLNPVPGKPGRFALHDLLRLYARERADQRRSATEKPPSPGIAEAAAIADRAPRTTGPAGPAGPAGTAENENGTASSSRDDFLPWIRRAVHFYLAAGRTATEQFTSMAARRRRIGISDERVLVSGSTFTDSAEAVAWIRAEADNLPAVMRLACMLPADESGVAAGLAAALANPLYAQASYRSLIELNELAAKALADGPDPGMYAVIDRDLAAAYLQVGQPTEALAYYRRECDSCADRDDQYGTAVALQGVGLCLRQLPGELPAAAEAFAEAHRLHRLIGNEVGQGSALNNLANVRQEGGDLESARQLYEHACAIFTRTGECGRLATARANLAEIYQQVGRLEEAAAAYADVVAELRTAGYSRIEMNRLWDLGDVLHQLGRVESARERWRQALELAATLGVLAPEEVESIVSDPTPVRPRALMTT